MASLRKETRGIIKSSKPSPRIFIKQAHRLLDDCRTNGTVQFSRLARLAFIGKIMLKSLVKKNIVSEQFYHLFLNSISTVATKMNSDFSLLRQGKLSERDFLKMYGHLRPGTYDITSPRYDKNPNLLRNVTKLLNPPKQKSILEIDEKIYEKISRILSKHKIECDAIDLFNFIKSSLEAREFAKFEFTKSLSDAIEYITEAGELLGFSREDLSNLDINSILKCETKNLDQIKKYWKNLIDRQEAEKELNEKIVLPPIIFSEKDFDIINYYSARPNFITQKRIEANTLNLDKIGSEKVPDLEGKIVVLESGDPGYDWVFTKDPAGLITKYGGVASHMAIRCAEFGIPAAIGCGEILFNNIKRASSVILDCKSGRIIPT
jgi:phosphohistidine swiveling domain-containing protein